MGIDRSASRTTSRPWNTAYAAIVGKQRTAERLEVLTAVGTARRPRSLSRAARSGAGGQDALIEVLKSLQVLPPGTTALVLDERYQPKAWVKWRR